MLDGVLESQDATLGLRLIANKMVFPEPISTVVPTWQPRALRTRIYGRGAREKRCFCDIELLVHSHDGANKLRAPDDGWEDRSRSVVSREAGLGAQDRSGKLPLCRLGAEWVSHGPALHMPLPLSTTSAATSSGMIDMAFSLRLLIGARRQVGGAEKPNCSRQNEDPLVGARTKAGEPGSCSGLQVFEAVAGFLQAQTPNNPKP